MASLSATSQLGRYRKTSDALHTHTMTVYPGAQSARISKKLSEDERREQRGGGRRGGASPRFTKRQRSTLEKRVGELDLSVSFEFVTLTYPDNYERYPTHGFPTDFGDYRGDFDRFMRQLRYNHEELGAVWRLEFQPERGAPHFHMVLYGLAERPLHEVEVELTSRWLDVTGVSHASEAACHSVKVTRPDTKAKRRKSLGYLGKMDEAQLESPFIEHAGRFWGRMGKNHLPKVAPVQYHLTCGEAHRIRRSMRAYRDKTSNRRIGAHPHNRSLVLRRGSGDDWQRLVRCIIGEREYVDTATGEVKTWAQINGGQNGEQASSAVDGRTSTASCHRKPQQLERSEGRRKERRHSTRSTARGPVEQYHEVLRGSSGPSRIGGVRLQFNPQRDRSCDRVHVCCFEVLPRRAAEALRAERGPP